MTEVFSISPNLTMKPSSSCCALSNNAIVSNALVFAACVLSEFFFNALNCKYCLAQERLPYNQKELVVDLGVGLWAWPMPLDWDNDGDLDLVVSCPDVPYNGTYLFENVDGASVKFPTFKPAIKVGDGLRSPQVSYVDGQARVMIAGIELTDFREKGFTAKKKIYPNAKFHPAKRIRANQWKYDDFDDDGKLDLVVGVGDWTDYGWDNAYDAKGNWTNGPLRGFVYLIRNRGTTKQPEYASPKKIQADGKPIDVFGMPSPCFDDFDGDGDLDLVCGEFLDGFTYFQNIGTRNSPTFTSGVRLQSERQNLAMDLQMITPTSIDWDQDGDIDLVCGDEDGRVALIENIGLDDSKTPIFKSPKYFLQKAKNVKFGALVTPVSVDWDADGDDDLICGNTAGYIGFIENLGMKSDAKSPTWAKPVYLSADEQVIRIQAGENGSIQGPAEAKWGYTTLSVADWNHDGKPDIVVNSIWGKVIWFENVGTKASPKLAAAKPIEVSWGSLPAPKPNWNWWAPNRNELVTQWRTTPMVFDVNNDGLNDLVSLDHEGYLAFYERKKMDSGLALVPPQRIFLDDQGKPLRMNEKSAGGSGRRKMCLVDWDGDGRVDLLANSRNIDFYKNVSENDGEWRFKNMGPVSKKRLAGHTTSPAVVDWNKDSIPDLLIGAEDGFLYYFENPRRGRTKTEHAN